MSGLTELIVAVRIRFQASPTETIANFQWHFSVSIWVEAIFFERCNSCFFNSRGGSEALNLVPMQNDSFALLAAFTGHRNIITKYKMYVCKNRTSEYAKICLDVILVAYSKKVDLNRIIWSSWSNKVVAFNNSRLSKEKKAIKWELWEHTLYVLQ